MEGEIAITVIATGFPINAKGEEIKEETAASSSGVKTAAQLKEQLQNTKNAVTIADAMKTRKRNEDDQQQSSTSTSTSNTKTTPSIVSHLYLLTIFFFIIANSIFQCNLA